MKLFRRKTVIGAILAPTLIIATACTSAVEATASYAGGKSGSSSSSKSSSNQSSSSSSSNKSSTSSTQGSSGSTSGSTDPQDPTGAAKAPSEPFKYKNGVTITVGDAVAATIDGTFSTETGRNIPVVIDNASTSVLNMSSYRFDSTVYCGSAFGDSAYIFPSPPDTGPATLAGGQKQTYTLPVGVKKTDLGGPCLVTVIFKVDNVDQSSIDPAKFLLTVK